MEQTLAVPLCLMMAQQRLATIFPAVKPNTPAFMMHQDKRHLKLIGKLYDQCQDTLVQFITFLNLQLSLDEIHKRLPPIDQLLLTYHISPDVAFALWRSNYMSSIHAKFEEFRKADRKDKQDSSSAPSKVCCLFVFSPPHSR